MRQNFLIFLPKLNLSLLVPLAHQTRCAASFHAPIAAWAGRQGGGLACARLPGRCFLLKVYIDAAATPSPRPVRATGLPASHGGQPAGCPIAAATLKPKGDCATLGDRAQKNPDTSALAQPRYPRPPPTCGRDNAASGNQGHDQVAQTAFAETLHLKKDFRTNWV